LTTIAGIVAVSIVGFLFIPHWTAVLFVSPLITTLYIDLLGKSTESSRGAVILKKTCGAVLTV
jgi:hypothetical protein